MDGNKDKKGTKRKKNGSGIIVLMLWSGKTKEREKK
jgi:hypothetical protein